MMNDAVFPLISDEICIRDPFIVADADSGLYHLYAQARNRAGSDFAGVEAYSSPDLKRWSEPKPVLVLPAEMDLDSVWAPEVHFWKGRWYLLVTLTSRQLLDEAPPVEHENWPPMHRRGTYGFVAESPLGPFEPLASDPLTPPEWMALDGTLYVEDGRPWLVFSHEWVQVVDGEMQAIPLSDDLRQVVGEPRLLFRASEAPGCVGREDRGLITDGPFMHRTAGGDLFMLWSTFLPGHEYSLLTARSAGGTLAGPWTEQRVVAGQDGGHGMIFRDFTGAALLALHRPNIPPGKERLRLLPVREDGHQLYVGSLE